MTPRKPRSRKPLAVSLCVLAVSVAVALSQIGCGSKPTTTEAPSLPGLAPQGAPDPDLTGPDFLSDVTAKSGIDFSYRNGEEVPHLAILESLGGGLAVIDYDGDGLPDLFLPGGRHYEGPDKLHALTPFVGAAGLPAVSGEPFKRDIRGNPCRLYHNEGNWKFRDVTEVAGLKTLAGGEWFYTHGATVGDYDRDGWPDLLVTGWGRVALLHNEPDGKGGRKFVDVSAATGLDKGITWATSAAFADFDSDGFPDLFVCQYVDWSFANHPDCNYDGKTPDVCPPKKFKGLTCKVFRNTGAGKFEDVSESAGMVKGGENSGKSLGVVVVDVNQDGKPDVYVANDTVANFLYVNKSEKGNIKFVEKGKLAGVALDGGGGPNGSMGVDAGDPERTGKPCLWVTNYENEFHALYRNLSAGDHVSFLFATQASGIGAIGQKFVGWGTGFVDFDHDGWEDIFIANGHAIRFPTGASRLQKPVLFLNRGDGTFKDISTRGGPYFAEPHLSRGVVLADFDNDGHTDIAVCQTNSPMSILKNVLPTGDRTWVGMDLVGEGNRDVVGARVMVESGGKTQTRFAKGGSSYASSPDRRFVFGLGNGGKVTKLTVVWPDGSKQEWTDVPTGKYHVLVQGDNKLQTTRPRR